MSLENLEETVNDHEKRIRCMEKSVITLDVNFQNINASLGEIVEEVGKFKWWVFTSLGIAILMALLMKVIGL